MQKWIIIIIKRNVIMNLGDWNMHLKYQIFLFDWILIEKKTKIK